MARALGIVALGLVGFWLVAHLLWMGPLETAAQTTAMWALGLLTGGVGVAAAVLGCALIVVGLVHYRNTWYLDAWCHASDALRRFALDAMEDAEVLPERAKAVPLAHLEDELDQGYGIFGGGKLKAQWATLVFDADAAQWVASEEWHPAQQGLWLDDGSYQLKLPYADPTELLMDLLRHAGTVEVHAPLALKKAYAQRLQRAAQRTA